MNPALAYCRQMQENCKKRYLEDGDEFALLGLSDWAHEELIIESEESKCQKI